MKNKILIVNFFLIVFIMFTTTENVFAQITPAPKNATNQNKLPVPAKPLNKKDSVVLVAAPRTVEVNTRLASADEIYLQRGKFLIRTTRDFRYITEHTDYSKSTLLWEHFGDPRQLWTFVPATGGYYKIKSGSGLFLQWGGGTVGNLPRYTISGPQSNTDKQLWQLVPANNGNYYIKSKDGYFLGAYGNNTNNSAPVSSKRDNDNTLNPKWHLINMSTEGRRMTTVDPVRHGFRFINTFNGEDIIRWGGLCGGMVYSVLDYFHKRVSLPTQSYTPANATPLQSYIYQRQQHSMWNVHEKWSEFEVNPFGSRHAEFFSWGIQGFGGGRLEELKSEIDRSRAVPIGLFTGGVGSIDGRSTGNHVALAVGYSLGRYTGDFNGYPGDFRIFVYDPNQGNRMLTLVPNMEGKYFFEVETGMSWRTYFVNREYDMDHTPPVIPTFPELEPEGSIRHLYAMFKTGGDDLRGGNDNVSITVSYADGTTQSFSNVNNKARWVDNSSQTVHIELNRPVRKSDIRHFMLTTSFGNGSDSDDWNLDGFQVSTGWGGIIFAESFAPAGQYIFRFSGDENRQRHTIRVVN